MRMDSVLKWTNFDKKIVIFKQSKDLPSYVE